jgi:hypothetical protein
MSRQSGRVGSASTIILSPEGREQRARARLMEEQYWRRQSGHVMRRVALGDERRAIARGDWRPLAFASRVEDYDAGAVPDGVGS